MDSPSKPHPTDQTLHAYRFGKLDDSTAESVSVHLGSCQACRRRVGELISKSFIGRPRDAQSQPVLTAPVFSSLAGPSIPAANARQQPEQEADPSPPGLVDHPDYEIKRELGRGGMGVVYLARNKLMARDEVLKVVGQHLVERKGVVERFSREIRSAARLDHPNIVRAYSAFRSGDNLILAMEYVEGLDLAKLIKSKGPLPVPNACNYIHQAALGLQHACEHGMVHRDIKPGNLVLARRGDRAVVKVLDFGLAKASREEPVDGSLTHEGQMLGTPDFIAPEQIRDAQSADIRADIYSLGCSLYYLLTAGPPFTGSSLYDVLQAHFSADAMPLNLARPEVPVELASIVAKMMAKEPARRFQTPKDVAQVLKPFFKTGSEQAGTPRVDLSQFERNRLQDPTKQRGHADIRMSAGGPTSVSLAAPHLETAGSGSPAWQGLISIEDADDPVGTLKSRSAEQDRSDTHGPVRQPRWFWPMVTAGALVLGLVAVWGLLLRTRATPGAKDLVPARKNAEVVAQLSRSTQLSSDPETPSRVAPGEPAEPVDTGKEPERTQPPARREWINSMGMKFVRIDPGEFRMGSRSDQVGQLVQLYPSTKQSDWWNGEQPQHLVTITRPFLLGVYEVTQGQYKAVTGENPSRFKGSEHLPVERVTWIEAVKFCNRLSEQRGRKPYYAINGVEVALAGGNGYRLPTEAEWEYACRAGTSTLYPFGDDPGAIGEHAWYFSNSGKATQPVGQKRANPWGIHDLMGNVWEWCADWYDVKYYGSVPATDPPGARQTSYRVIRGGAWECFPGFCRPGFRGKWAPRDRGDFLGFRVAIDLSPDLDTVSSAIPSRLGKTADPPKEPKLTWLPASREFTNSIGMKFVRIEPGEFLMGSNQAQVDQLTELFPQSTEEQLDDEQPQHSVKITRPYLLGVYEVTQGQYQAVTGNNPSKFGGSADLPVERISWLDAVKFCDKLSDLEGRTPYYRIDGESVTFAGGNGYRLPTEAEWEKACRAGKETLYPFGDDGPLDEYAWFRKNADSRTHPVGQRRPNPWGLHDMMGNVWEWCADWYDEKYYESRPATDPPGGVQGSRRVVRGGGWVNGPGACRPARRFGAESSAPTAFLGFRVAAFQE